MEIGILIAVVAVVVICEIISGHQRAETDKKISSIERLNEYIYARLKNRSRFPLNGWDEHEPDEIEYRNNELK